MRSLIVAKFNGELADQHKLPAYEAMQSLSGISRSLIITTNYLMEGKVRHRRFEGVKFKLNLLAQQEGSFESLFELITDPNAMQILDGIALTGPFLLAFIKTIYSRAIGEAGDNVIEELEEDQSLNSGDMSALVDAIEPSLREAHKVIGRGAATISLSKGPNSMVNFNEGSKRYINASEIDDRLSTKDFSVGSFNANSGYGRAFDLEEGRTIPFEIQVDADRISIESILSSIASYTRRRRLGDDINSRIALKYRAVRSIEGKVKKLLVVKARRHVSEL